jgi:hypothetical protein
MSLLYSIFELKRNPFAQHEITQNTQMNDSTPAHLHSETSSVRVVFLCCPHCVETGIQFLELATKRKSFDLYQLATGLGRVAENTNSCQGQTAELQKCFINVQNCCRFVAKHRVSVLFLFCQFSVDPLKERATRLLGLWVQIPPAAWISVSCGCCALSVEGVCDRPIPPPEETYWLWCGTVCDQKTWRIRRPGCCVRKKNTAEFQNTRIIVGIVRGMEVSRVANTYKIWPTVRKEYWKTNTDVKRLPED